MNERDPERPQGADEETQQEGTPETGAADEQSERADK